jgi:hypothetical protein
MAAAVAGAAAFSREMNRVAATVPQQPDLGVQVSGAAS